MDFSLNKEQKDIKKAAREFVEKQIVPYADEWDEQHYYPYKEVVKKMGELSFFGCCLPEDYGGNDFGFLAQMIITEEIARGSSSMRVVINMQALGTALSIYRYGSEVLKQTYISKLMTAEYLGCFAITEPDAGSDVMAIKTKAEDKEDYFLLNGSKTWISQVTLADVVLVYAYTDHSMKSKGMSAFLVEPKNMSGVSTTTLDKLGTRSLPTGEIFFDNVKVPKENLVGNLGDGVKILFSSLCQTRLSAAAGAIGVAQACLEVATKYAKEREQFGEPIGKQQMIQDTIAKMAIEIEAARLMVYKAAWQKDQGMLGNNLEVAHAKYIAGEAAVHCADSAMRILSAYSYSTEYPAARYLRDAYAYPVVEGTANICKWITALDQLGYRRANR